MDEIKSINQKINQAYLSLLLFLDNDDNYEERFNNVIKCIQENGITRSKYKIKQFLHIISSISLYHRRSSQFFPKIESILKNIRDQIQKYCSNDQLYNIFSNNKRILLFLLQERILILTMSVATRLSQFFSTFFYTELNANFPHLFTSCPIKDNPLDFQNKREIGENDLPICEAIRKDSLTEFHEIFKTKRISINYTIRNSIYETNKFLERDNLRPTLIDYAAFYGSGQIFTFLFYNKSMIRSCTFLYAIHGRNMNIIKLLLGHFNGNDKSVNKLLFHEAIRFHCCDLADFLHKAFLILERNEIYESFYIALDTYNYEFICKEFVYSDEILFELFWHFCACDYYENAKICLSNSFIDVNKKHKGFSALSIAISRGHVDIVELLLKQDNIDVNQVSDEGRTALHYAAYSGYIDIVKQLIQHQDIDLNCQTANNKSTPLIISLGLGYLDVAKLLISIEAVDVNCESNDKLTPLLYCTSKQYIECISLLLKRNDILVDCHDKNNQTPFYISISSGKIDLVDLFLNFKTVDVNTKVKNGYTPLLLSTSCDYPKIVEKLLEIEEIDVNCQTDQGWTPLMIAASHGFSIITKLLLKHHLIDINIKNNNNMTALMIASINGYHQIVKMLLEQPNIDTESKSNENNTALFYAARNSRVDVVVEFINQKKFDLNCLGALDFSLLTMAICKKSIAIVKLLLVFNELDVNVLWKNYSPLFLAIVVNNPEIIKLLLLRNDTDVNYKNENKITPLFYAAQTGCIQAVNLLLKRYDIDVNCKCGNKKLTPLMVAVIFHHPAVVDLLIKNEYINVNYQCPGSGLSAIILATLTKDQQILSLLVSEPKVDVNSVDKGKSSSLHFASFLNNSQSINILLTRKDIRANEHNKEGLTPLCIAAKYDKKQALGCLMNDSRIDVNCCELKMNNSPLHIAVNYCNVDIVTYLLNDERVDVNIKNEIGISPLYLAVLKKICPIVKVMIGYGRINVNDTNGPHSNTALHETASNGNYNIALMLLSRSEIDVNCRNELDKTPLFIAVEKDNKEIVQILLSHPDLDVNCQCGKKGDTPLHLAVKLNNQQIIKLLLTHTKISIDCKNSLGEVPLMLAQDSEFITHLLEERRIQ